LIIDATRGFEGQDQSIFWLAEKNRKGLWFGEQMGFSWKRCQLVTMKKNQRRINAIYGCAYSFVSAITTFIESIRSNR
jgi:hypothetical protein